MKARHSQKHSHGNKPHAVESEPESPEPTPQADEAGEGQPAAAEPTPAGVEGWPADSTSAQGEAPDTDTGSAESDDPTAALSAELEAQQDRYLRLAAEFDNYRRRSERERSSSGVRAQIQVVDRVLEALDDLQRVSLIDPETATGASVLEGVQLVERKLVQLLESVGLEPLDAEGRPFDPEIHEALATMPAESREEDDIVGEVFQRGYRFKGTLVRPARVRVKKHEG